MAQRAGMSPEANRSPVAWTRLGIGAGAGWSQGATIATAANGPRPVLRLGVVPSNGLGREALSLPDVPQGLPSVAFDRLSVPAER